MLCGFVRFLLCRRRAGAEEESRCYHATNTGHTRTAKTTARTTAKAITTTTTSTAAAATASEQ